MAENKSEINPRSVRQSPGLSRHKQPVQLGSQMYALGKHVFATEERIQGEKSLLSIGCILKFAPFLPGELVDNQPACRTAANGEAGIGNEASDTVGIIGQKTAPAILDITAVAQLMECRDIAFSADAEMRTEAEPCDATNAERSSLCAEADPGDLSGKSSQRISLRPITARVLESMIAMQGFIVTKIVIFQKLTLMRVVPFSGNRELCSR